MTDSPNAVPLKPCPFCESTNIALAAHPGAGRGFDHHGDTVYSLDCMGCGASFPNRYRREILVEQWNRRVADAAQTDPATSDAFARLTAFHAEQLDSNPYCYFELAYTRMTGWMAWITDRPAKGEPGTAEYAKSRKVIVRGQADTAIEACEDALAALDRAAASAVNQEVDRG